MSLGFALILVVILYLIDKHGVWKQAVKVTIRLFIALVVLLLLLFAGFDAWETWERHKAARLEKQQQEEYARVFQEHTANCNSLWKKAGRPDYDALAELVRNCDDVPGPWHTELVPGEKEVPIQTAIKRPRLKVKPEQVMLPDSFHYGNVRDSFGVKDSALGTDDSGTHYTEKDAFCNADNRKVGDVFIAVKGISADYFINFPLGSGRSDVHVPDYETPERKIAAGDKLAAEEFNQACR